MPQGLAFMSPTLPNTARDVPMMMVLSLSSSWDDSMEGIVPDRERSLGIVAGGRRLTMVVQV
jgi:hypothetical protein